MTAKSNPDKTAPETPANPFAQLQEAGFGNFAAMGTAWMEAMSDIGAEAMSFVAERLKEDVKTQHEMLHCKDMDQLQHIQAEFVQKAIDQYQEETGKLVEMSTQAFQPPKSED
ncbi:phasin family protein [Aestuariicoccus sp. MJ-SS9]|uniref:phasin family protein n=1 Tax=Aestuariicoccus sp. MJ-SS9 TaxID=3079855 RepID=UPI00290DE13E|nr:phasin family protein [Aestuariicoccus sp. MJ-SS9]MDU8911610.1 phasin family protein [Aestuariicoccus sp. MJ-SS9]